MADHGNKSLQVLEVELHSQRHHVPNILTEDFDALDETEMAVASTLRALEEHKLGSDPVREVNPTAPPLAA